MELSLESYCRAQNERDSTVTGVTGRLEIEMLDQYVARILLTACSCQ